MTPEVAAKHARMRQALRLQRPDRLPCSDWVWVEYRPDVYHLGDMDVVPEAGQVAVSADGRRRYTRDGGVWALGAAGDFHDHTDVLRVDLDHFEVETVDERMVAPMRRLYAEAASRGYPMPHHYGTLVTRATIAFGWEPFLCAAALEPEAFGRVLDRFGAASLAVVQGWTRVRGVEVISIHDDIAATRGPILRPEWYRRYVFPWYERLFAACHEGGCKALWVCDGNYLEILPDILATGVDGLYCESSSMDPAELLARAGPDKFYIVKTCSRIIDFGTPEEIRRELARLRELHRHYPGLMIYRGGGYPRPGNAEAFAQAYDELLVYDREQGEQDA